MRRLLLLVGLLLVVTSIAACSGATHQSSQAAATDKSSGGVSQMPSGFRNVAYKCIRVGGTYYAVFSTSIGGNNDNKPGSVAAVADPSCKHDGP